MQVFVHFLNTSGWYVLIRMHCIITIMIISNFWSLQIQNSKSAIHKFYLSKQKCWFNQALRDKFLKSTKIVICIYRFVSYIFDCFTLIQTKIYRKIFSKRTVHGACILINHIIEALYFFCIFQFSRNIFTERHTHIFMTCVCYNHVTVKFCVCFFCD